MLSRKFALSLFSSLLLAGSVSALQTTYNLTSGAMTANSPQGCGVCSAPVTGYFTLNDDGAGNVTLVNMNLSQPGYEIANPSLVSVILTRSSISVNGTAAGTGTTIGGNAIFGSSVLSQIGTSLCTPGSFPCAVAGLPTGLSPLMTGVGVNLGTWVFDLLGNLTSASFLYTNNPNATETLSFTASPVAVPEPGTALLLGLGLTGMALRRRRA